MQERCGYSLFQVPEQEVMTTGDPLATGYEVAAFRLAASDPEAAILGLLVHRRRLCRGKWWAEAQEVASSAFTIADATGRADLALQVARWSANRFPSADTYLLLGDALSRAGRIRGAHLAWSRAASLADRLGALTLARTARAQLAQQALDRETLELQQIIPRAWNLAETDFGAAIDLLSQHRKAMLRRGARRDARDALRLCVLVCQRAAQTRLGKRFAARLVADAPSAESVRLLAELELASGDAERARKLSQRAERLARREGSLKELRLAAATSRKFPLQKRRSGVKQG